VAGWVNGSGKAAHWVVPGATARHAPTLRMSYPLALLAAFANAGSNVLQRAANRSLPSNGTFSPKRVVTVMRHPAWLGGIITVLPSFLLMAMALRLGHLAAVEPVIILELPLTLLLASRVFYAPSGEGGRSL
jgi:hypothetical protein